MFGKAFLVAPITEAGVKEWSVYLPNSTIWYNFWTGKRFNGGQTIITDAPVDKIPLFVKAGSIIPMGKIIQYAAEQSDTLEIRVYKGADGRFELYEDEDDNYDYEKGKYSIISFKWNEKTESLTIGDKQGNYPGSLKKRIFNIVYISQYKKVKVDEKVFKNEISYFGKKIVLKTLK
jgi:alpha-D-xyloside xylohydrolase